MDIRINNFISKNKVFTLATSVDNLPYCANCFYAYDEVSNRLFFLSDNNTKHITEALINKRIGGAIQNGVTEVSKLQGIQFIGKFIDPTAIEQDVFYEIYYEKFPFAKTKSAPIWAIELNWIKMTDNSLGFGKKLIWERIF